MVDPHSIYTSALHRLFQVLGIDELAGAFQPKLIGFDNHWRERLGYYRETEEYRKLRAELEQELVRPTGKLAVPVVVSLIGIPGSGKSTFSTLLQEFFPALHLRSDVIGLLRLPKGPGYDYYKAYVIQEDLARFYLTQGYSVILDDNNRTRYNREQVYKLAQECKGRNLLFRLNLPLDLAIYRTRQRDTEEGRAEVIASREQVRRNLMLFQEQIEEPEDEEIKGFNVSFRIIDCSSSLSEIRNLLQQDLEFQQAIS